MSNGASAIASSRAEPLISHTPAITTKATENAARVAGVSLRELAQRARSLGTRSAAIAARRPGASSSAVIGILPAGVPFSQRTEAPVIRCGNHANRGRLNSWCDGDTDSGGGARRGRGQQVWRGDAQAAPYPGRQDARRALRDSLRRSPWH